MLAWPFLISRNRTIDYKVVVAPDFLVSSGQDHILVNISGEQATEKPIWHKLNSDIGILSLVFMVKPAKANQIILRDEFGRPILWTEGMVFRDNIEGFEVSDADFHRLHKQMQVFFQSFWDIEESDFEVVASKPLDIALTESAYSQREPIEKKSLPTTSNKGWSSVRRNYREQYGQLERKREKVDRNYKIGLACSIVGVPLIAFFGVGILITPVSGIVAWQNYQKRTELDEQIKKLEDKLR